MKIIISLSIFVFSTALVKASEPQGITLSELRQTISVNQNTILTAHIVFFREETQNLLTDTLINEYSKEDNDRKLYEANRNIVTEENVILDTRIKAIKQVITDIRDTNRILKEYDIPDTGINRLNLDKSIILLSRDNDLFSLSPAALCGSLQKSASPMNPDLTKLGIIPKTLLDNQNIQLSNLGGPLLKIEISTGTNGAIKDVFTCDSSIGYRYRMYQRKAADKVIMEIVNDDFRDVNGIPCPFSYTFRLFNIETGTLSREDKIAIEKAEFGIELLEDDFKIFVPKNAIIESTLPVSSTIEKSVPSKIRTGKKMGMDEIVTLGSEAVELYKAQHQQTQ